MNLFVILFSLATLLQEGDPVRFSANFDSGSLGRVDLIDMLIATYSIYALGKRTGNGQKIVCCQ
jgi:hypothetical protein